MTVTTTTARFSYVGDGNAGPDTATGIKVLASTDVKVYWNKASSGSGTPVTVGDTSTAMSTSGYLTLNTHYTVQNAGTNNDITITLVASGWTISSTLAYATSSDTLVVTREVPYTQPSNYQNNDTFDAETLEQSLDRSTMQIQQLTDVADRNFVFSSTLSDSDFNSAPLSGTDFSTVRERASTVITGKTARANKVLGFDANGDVSATQEIGSFLGNWAASTAYIARDIVKDASNSNIYICNTAHSSTGSTPVSTNTDVAKWTLIVDAASTTTSTTTASEWASKTSGIVASTDYSAKAYAIGGTGVTTSSGKGAAKEWATTTGGAVDTSEYSAKEYSVGTTATSSKSYALKVDGAVTGTDFSSKAWAVGGTNVTTTSSRGAAKEWATSTGAAVDTSEYSAKEYAIGDETASGGSAKAWAIDGSSPDDSGEKSAKTLAGEASTSAGLASDHRADAGKYAVTGEDTTFSLTSTNGGTSGLYSAKHYQAKAQANQTAAASSATAAASSAASAMNTGKAIAFSLIFGA